MKSLIWLRDCIAIPFLGLLLFLLFHPYFGFLFLGGIVASLLVWFLGNDPQWIAYAYTALSIGWKAYVGYVVATFFVIETFLYQSCCVGMQSFSAHIRHAGAHHIEALGVGFFWPVCWFIVDRNLKGWTLSWIYAILWAMDYWFVQRWRGVPIESIDVQTGTTTTTRVKSGEEAMQVMKQEIKKHL